MNNEDLPLHVYDGTKEDALDNLVLLRQQIEEVRKCDKFPCVKVGCAKCGKRVSVFMLFKCLYCGLWFCKTCAERHFGERVPKSILLDESLPALCSGYGVFPDGTKCEGCADCRPKGYETTANEESTT